MNNVLSWKDLATSLFTALRVFFLVTSTWDFFLTIVAKASQRALVLTGIGASYTPYIVMPWACSIILLAFLLLDHLRKKDQSIVTRYGVYVYVAFIAIYISLAILAVINPLVSWPLVLNFLANAGWAVAIMYFRFKLKSTGLSN